MPVDLYTALRKIFKYLKWKSVQYTDTFNAQDLRIVNDNSIEKFCELSSSACKYTKNMIQKYPKQFSRESPRNELQAEGHTHLPNPKCDPLQLPRDLTRQEEVQIMSLCYTNNLLNGFLYRFDSHKFPNPLCHCGQQEQTNYHVAAECSYISGGQQNGTYRRYKISGRGYKCSTRKSIHIPKCKQGPQSYQHLMQYSKISTSVSSQRHRTLE